MLFTEDLIQRIKELNPTVYVRTAKKADAESFVIFFNAYYKRKTTKEYFIWQFFESPYLSKLFLAFDGKDLVGCYGVKLHPLTDNSFSCFSVDFLIAQTHRKKGIAYLLDQQVTNFCIENEACCLTSLPNAYGNAAFKSLGSKSLIKVDSLILSLDQWKKNVIDFSKNNEPAIDYIEFQKDQDYRKWRFDLNPLYKYKYTVLNDNCFAISKIFTDLHTNQLFYDIVEFHFDTLENANSLIQLVISNIDLEKSAKLSIWALPHTKLYMLLIKIGFLHFENERYFCLKFFSRKFKYLADIKIWNISEADAEIY